MLELLYRALNSPLGIVVHTNHPERCRQKLYAARRESGDPGLAGLSFVFNHKDDSELWIINRENQNGRRPSEDHTEHNEE